MYTRHGGDVVEDDGVKTQRRHDGWRHNERDGTPNWTGEWRRRPASWCRRSSVGRGGGRALVDGGGAVWPLSGRRVARAPHTRPSRSYTRRTFTPAARSVSRRGGGGDVRRVYYNNTVLYTRYAYVHCTPTARVPPPTPTVVVLFIHPGI